MANQSQQGGALTNAIRTIRLHVDDPAARAKYTDDVLVGLMSDAWPSVLQDIYGQTQHPPLARFAVDLVEGQEYYYLPATVGEVWEVAKFDDQHRMMWRIKTRHRKSSFLNGVTFEGTQRFRVDPSIYAGESIEVDYIPSGDIVLHQGTALPSGCTTSTLTMGNTVTLGAEDRRPNAYIGSLLSVNGFSGGVPSGYRFFPVQQRIITDHAVGTGVLTVAPNFDFDLSTLPGGSPTPVLSYEVYPIEATLYFKAVALRVARDICGLETKPKAKFVEQLYNEARRSASLLSANFHAGMQANRLDPAVDTNEDCISDFDPWGLP